MENLTYVTGNYGKYISVKEKFEQSGIIINYYRCDLDEPDINDIKIISKEKAKQAYEKIGSPVFVADSGFYIDNYPNNPGYPGAFVKRSGVSSNVSDLLDVMKDVKDRSCYFLDCLTFYDGNEYYQFFGISKGKLAKELRGHENKKAKSNLWYVFVPDNCTKTLSEMTDEERNNRPDNRTSATDEFIKWYIPKYMNKNAKKVLKNKRNTNKS